MSHQTFGVLPILILEPMAKPFNNLMPRKLVKATTLDPSLTLACHLNPNSGSSNPLRGAGHVSSSSAQHPAMP